MYLTCSKASFGVVAAEVMVDGAAGSTASTNVGARMAVGARSFASGACAPSGDDAAKGAGRVSCGSGRSSSSAIIVS
jgi:hypothetical protein